MLKQKIHDRLAKAHPLNFALFAIFFAWLTYLCMYSFRKPFAVGRFEGDIEILGIIFDYKLVLIITQILGYTLSKFIGIKVVSEAKFAKRGFYILGLIGVAEIALLLFALVPKPYNTIFLFFNGLPLGMIWGLVFSYLEGRRMAEVLGAGLSSSFIVSSGLVKSLGSWVLSLGVSEFWMPFITGLFSVPFLLFSVFMMECLPRPSAEEEKEMTKRVPMDATNRKKFFLTYLSPLVLLVFMFMFVTAFRDFRDNFAREIWDALGYGSNPEIFTITEVPIAVCVLFILSALVFVKDRKKNFYFTLVIIAVGISLIGTGTALYQAGVLPPVYWMVLTGLAFICLTSPLDASYLTI